ncbi:hypothetical protein NMY22_g12649 [Coprinellus aureogranulatus]|nr:hypothetical protein NMY22_g12649 [Coprinellus aureogranulatus]
MQWHNSAVRNDTVLMILHANRDVTVLPPHMACSAVIHYIIQFVTTARRATRGRYDVPASGALRAEMLSALFALGPPSRILIVDGDFSYHGRTPTLRLQDLRVYEIRSDPEEPTNVELDFI